MTGTRNELAVTAARPFQSPAPWVVAVLFSLGAGFASIEVTRNFVERNQQDALATETSRRAVEIMATTLNGNVMGSVAALGLLSPLVKQAAHGQLPPQHGGVMETLRAVGESYRANAVFVVDRSGVVRNSWFTTGRSLNGDNVSFRPYFTIAMQGRQNVYAAIGTTNGAPSLYFAAPLYERATLGSPVIGATVARLDIERIDLILKAWKGPALLLSPQQITFASNRSEWVEHIGREPTPEQLGAIRKLRQFGNTFENGVPRALPFNTSGHTASIDGRRHALVSAPVQWNDPQGDWTLLLLRDLDGLMSPSGKFLLGAASAAIAFVLSALFIVWRRHLQHADMKRQRAESELKAYADQLQTASNLKSWLAEVSADLQQATSLESFAGKLMSHATRRLDAPYGAFYVLDDESALLMPMAGHGAMASELGSLAVGEGLAGQCAKDRATIVIADPSQTNIRIVWGGGSIAPRSVVFLPVVQSNRVLGVIVLAALRAFDADDRAVLDAMLPIVATNLEILKRHISTEQQAQALEQQQTQQQETEAWYRGIIEQAPDGMLVANEQGTIIVANPRMHAMFGYGPDSLVGQKIEVLVPVASRGGHVALREGFARGGAARAMGTLDMKLRGVRRDGSEFPIEVSLSNLPALGGRGQCVCAAVREVQRGQQARPAISQPS